MTKKEAFVKAKTIGKAVKVDDSMATHPDKLINDYELYNIRVDSITACGFKSYEECFEFIALQDPAKAKADKIAKLKADLEELES
jgi:hypothetical protein